jgi:TetR/AcrR family transcriptional regulator, cholesterol catabolism regulator
VPRPRKPALRAKYEQRQADVVRDAARVLAERGYDQTSVPELADAVGLATGGLYHYFASKEELLARICEQLMDPLLEEAQSVLNDEPDARLALRKIVRVWVAHAIAHRDHMLVFQQQRHVIEASARWTQVRNARKAFERLLETSLAAAETAGAVRYDDRRLAVSALLGMVNHTAQWYRPGGRLTPKRLADGYVDLILA